METGPSSVQPFNTAALFVSDVTKHKVFSLKLITSAMTVKLTVPGKQPENVMYHNK